MIKSELSNQKKKNHCNHTNAWDVRVLNGNVYDNGKEHKTNVIIITDENNQISNEDLHYLIVELINDGKLI